MKESQRVSEYRIRTLGSTIGWSAGQTHNWTENWIPILHHARSRRDKNVRIASPEIVPIQLVRLSRSTSWPRGYKTFFVLNSVEHEILNAHKYKNIKKFRFFLGSD